MSRKPKKIKDDEVPYEALVEGVSSAHSWIKSNTMLRPTKLSRKKGDGSDGEDDDEADILILITSRIPNTRGNEIRFTLDGEYEQAHFTETMIDHLDIESQIIVAECGEARLQVRRFGLPPLIGTEDEDEIRFREEVFKEDLKKLEITSKVTNQFHYLERATQTKNNDTLETEAQTDPPPMYV